MGIQADRLLRLLACLILVVGLSGCGGPRVVKVTGKVTRGSQPVPNLMVHFVPEVGRPSWGRTDANGDYKLNYEQGRDGAITGMHRVFVATQAIHPGEEAAFRKGGPGVHPEIAEILAKYGKRDSSPLQFEIKYNGQVVNLALD